MKIIFVATRPTKIGSTRIWVHNLSTRLRKIGHQTSILEPNALLDKVDADLLVLEKAMPFEHVRQIRKLYPTVPVGQINPSSAAPKILNLLDFGIVGSFEEKIYYQRYFPTIVCELVEDIPEGVHALRASHTENSSNRFTICYHGNRPHLTQLSSSIIWALNEFGKEKPDTILKLIYDVEKGGEVNIGVQNIHVQHVQWKEQSWLDEIATCDVGLVPGLTAINSFVEKLILYITPGHKNDYLLRYKNTSNSGRANVFLQIGLPMAIEYSPAHANLFWLGLENDFCWSKEDWLSRLNLLYRDWAKGDLAKYEKKYQFSRMFTDEKLASQLIDEIRRHVLFG